MVLLPLFVRTMTLRAENNFAAVTQPENTNVYIWCIFTYYCYYYRERVIADCVREKKLTNKSFGYRKTDSRQQVIIIRIKNICTRLREN